MSFHLLQTFTEANTENHRNDSRSAFISTKAVGTCCRLWCVCLDVSVHGVFEMTESVVHQRDCADLGLVWR